MNTATLAEWYNSMPVDKAETIKLEFAVAIDTAIKNLDLTRKEIAESMGTSPAWVTKVLRGDVNLTIETMVKLCEAVGQELQIKAMKKKESCIDTISVQSVFHLHSYSRPKFAGAYEIDLKNDRDIAIFCNDNEYAHAA